MVPLGGALRLALYAFYTSERFLGWMDIQGWFGWLQMDGMEVRR
jgi:hypothetical protein